jgi:hypothetical protein
VKAFNFPVLPTDCAHFGGTLIHSLKSHPAIMIFETRMKLPAMPKLWQGDLCHLKSDVAGVSDDPRADLDQLFSLSVVSDQSLIGTGVASVRRKLPRLVARA